MQEEQCPTLCRKEETDVGKVCHPIKLLITQVERIPISLKGGYGKIGPNLAFCVLKLEKEMRLKPCRTKP